MMQIRRGFTLIELMIVIAVVAVLVTLAAPSFYDFIAVQRLKGITAQIMTDLQFARTEAAARSVPVQLRFSSNSDESCYVLFTGNPDNCDCANTSTPVCPASTEQEIRTVHVPASARVSVRVGSRSPDKFGFDPATGALTLTAVDMIIDANTPIVIQSQLDSQRAIQVQLKYSGRPTMCTPSLSTVTGVASC
jgi:type IV fimbrial biogenesis protein FimT